MAISVEQPGFLQYLTYNEEQARRSWFFPFQRNAGQIGSVAGGVIGGGDLQVTYSGGGTTVNIAAGEIVVPGVSGTTQSGWPMRTTGGTLTPNNGNGSNPRIDLIYAQVSDVFYGDGSNAGQIALSQGTPTSGASLSNLNGAPAVPTRAIAIAYILVPTNATTINNADILNVAPTTYFQTGIFNTRPNAGSSITAKSGDHIIVSAGTPTITLPSPFVNARLMITNYGTGTVTVTHSGTEIIYGPGLSNGVTSFTLGHYGASATLYSDGASWFQVASTTPPYLASNPGPAASFSAPIGTSFQNTALYDIFVFGSMGISGAGSVGVSVGTNATSTVSANTVIFSSATLATGTVIPVALYIPAGYWAIISQSAGTATLSGLNAVAFPI